MLIDLALHFWATCPVDIETCLALGVLAITALVHAMVTSIFIALRALDYLPGTAALVTLVMTDGRLYTFAAWV